MRLIKSFIGLCILGSLSYASRLEVYQDTTLYTFTPETTFIGLTQNIAAKCEGKEIVLESSALCPSEERLCKELELLENLLLKKNETIYNVETLEKLSALPQPESIDAVEWIGAANLLAQEKASLFQKQKYYAKKYKIQEEKLYKQVPSKDILLLPELCSKDLTLTLPYGYVTFTISYEVELGSKELQVKQKINIVNRSGIDIKANKAMFYYKRANQYIAPMQFSPWIVGKYEPVKTRMYKKNTKSMMDISVAEESVISGNIMPSSVASYEDAREYKIEHLNLPSTGMPLEFEVLSWKSDVQCKLKAYPYINPKVFEVCSFEPKFQIDSHRWKVKKDDTVINDSAVGQYHKSTYQLYTQVDDDVQIIRKQMVQKERETGIFGGTARKKDGFTLTLINKSNHVKKLTLIERIPTSTTTEIESKLIGVSAKKKIEYKVLKDGKLQMQIKLNAHETEQIDVVFEISYDKDVKVRY